MGKCRQTRANGLDRTAARRAYRRDRDGHTLANGPKSQVSAVRVTECEMSTNFSNVLLAYSKLVLLYRLDIYIFNAHLRTHRSDMQWATASACTPRTVHFHARKSFACTYAAHYADVRTCLEH